MAGLLAAACRTLIIYGRPCQLHVRHEFEMLIFYAFICNWRYADITSFTYRASILFVVQGGERNVFDQRLLEYELLEK